jgi:3-oxoacyl-[acyl-carrier protein] reductase
MDLNGAGAAAVAADIGGRSSTGDVTRFADISRAVDAAQGQTGQLDIVVNNAGWTHRNKPMLEVTEEE